MDSSSTAAGTNTPSPRHDADETDTEHAPWYMVRSDDKSRARLNCIAHILDLIPFQKASRPRVKLPKRSKKRGYDDQATLAKRKFVHELY